MFRIFMQKEEASGFRCLTGASWEIYSKEISTLSKMSKPFQFPFESHYLNVSGIRMHYIDEGDKKAPSIIFLHGVPTWSYTFRKIIPTCVKSGYRVVAPDLPGFGLSEKTIKKPVVTLSWLVNLVREFVGHVQLDQPVLYAHDWGAVIGLLLASQKDDPFSGLILSNGLLPVPGMKAPFQFRIWRLFARISPFLPVGRIVDYGTRRRLSPMERKGYEYPFHTTKEKMTIRLMPRLLPMGHQHSEFHRLKMAWSNLEQREKPLLTLFSDGDPITRGGEKVLQERIPGSSHQDHIILRGGHFLQEDVPEEISRKIIGFMRKHA